MIPQITVSPDRALVDERLEVEATGFDTGTRVTLDARSRLGRTTWAGSATFEADNDGVVDPATQAPVDGESGYDGVRPMGLFQFAREVESDRLAPGETRLRAMVGNEVVATATCKRRLVADPVTRTPVGREDLTGDLLLPPGNGPHPGILLLGGVEGGRPVGPKAKLLASRGYAVLALAYFRADGLPGSLSSVPFEYFDRAVEWFSDHHAVRSEPLGIVGHSRGSEAALTAATRHDEVRTVVAYSPGSHQFQGFSPRTGVAGTSAWSENGRPVPFVPYRWGIRRSLKLSWKFLLASPVAFEEVHAGGLDDADSRTRSAGAIPVEEIGGPVLLVSGDDDRFWPATDFAERIVARLDDNDYDHHYEHLSYERAGHAIRAPYLPVYGRSAVATGRSRLHLDMGGAPEGYAAADADAWPLVLELLERGLRPETGAEIR